VIELALIHRLASLLWRLHRAIAIETGLFELQVEALPACRQDPSRGPRQPGTPPTQANGHSKVHVRDDPPIADHDNSLLPNIAPVWRTNCVRAQIASLTPRVFFDSKMRAASAQPRPDHGKRTANCRQPP
jgi:hypothetical protein